MCDKNLLLVATIEKYPCLYNHNLQDYMKKDITEKAWSEVSLQTSLTGKIFSHFQIDVNDLTRLKKYHAYLTCKFEP